jgi:hypothetical protein
MTSRLSPISSGLFALVLVAQSGGCSKTAPPEPQAAASPVFSAAPAPKAVEHASASGPDVTWTAPPSWISVPSTSAMRKATYKVPKAGKDTEDAELAVFYFGVDQGGSVEANMERWAGQFEGMNLAKSERAERTVNGLKESTIEVGGTYKGMGMPGMPGSPATPIKQAYRLLGAIVEGPNGKYFFKLTGPHDTVMAAKDGFYRLLDSMKAG